MPRLSEALAAAAHEAGPWPWCEMYRTWKSQPTPEIDTTIEHIGIVETWRAEKERTE